MYIWTYWHCLFTMMFTCDTTCYICVINHLPFWGTEPSVGEDEATGKIRIMCLNSNLNAFNGSTSQACGSPQAVYYIFLPWSNNLSCKKAINKQLLWFPGSILRQCISFQHCSMPSQYTLRIGKGESIVCLVWVECPGSRMRCEENKFSVVNQKRSMLE